MKKFRVVVLAALAAAAGLAACGKDPYAVVASFVTEEDTLFSYALNGTPPYQPAGVSSIQMRAVPIDSSFAFDFAFDIDSANRLLLLPVSRVGTTFGSSRSVGFDTTWHVPYDSIFKAHSSGYVFDSIVVVQPGRPFGVVAAALGCTGVTGSSVIYSKFVVDSVHAAERRIFMRGHVDPNCGFRSLRPGIPTS